MNEKNDKKPTALERWLEENGKTQVWLAEQFGVRPPSVHAWLTRVPAERVPRMSELTGIPMQALRPDLYSRSQVA